MNKLERIESLIEELNKASKSYYHENTESIGNWEYDRKYDELLWLESETGYIPENSPSRNIGYEVVGELSKVTHEIPALSLDKTKSTDDLLKWLNNKEAMLSWKLDGLTIQSVYDNGILTMAATRGNGEIGEDITHNAIYFDGLPREIPFKGHLVVRGEALISYGKFEEINQNLESEEQYKNPRNLASGSVRQLDSKMAAARGIEFHAFALVFADGEQIKTVEESFQWLEEQGFAVVAHVRVNTETLLTQIKNFEGDIEQNELPSDGLVLAFNDIAYGQSLGTTGKFPRHSIAFKWQDDVAETTLREITWQASRTGLINPVAVFDPVELEGTTVERATVFNVSTVEHMKLAAGSTITVYKANKIIPKIAECILPTGEVSIPSECPVCGSGTQIRENKKNQHVTRTLYCTNPMCAAKQIKKFVHFTKRDCMNIPGISEATIEKLVGMGYIKEFSDFYHLNQFQDSIVKMEGFGEKSYQKLLRAIEKSRNTKFERLMLSLGIPNVGKGTSKRISKLLDGSIEAFCKRLESRESFEDAEDVGQIINDSIYEWYDEQQRQKAEKGTNEFLNLLSEIDLIKVADNHNRNVLEGKTFVITGVLHKHVNRKELEKEIESYGGEIFGSVSKKTTHLINNDAKSESSKNKKAISLGVSIITEDEFLNIINP